MFSTRNSLQETQLSDLWDLRNLQLGWNYLTTISQFQSKKPWVYFHFFWSFCGTSLLGRYLSISPDTFLIVALLHKTSPLGNLHEATGCSSQWCSWKQRNKIQYRWSHVISVSNCSMGSQSGNSFLHKVRPCVSSKCLIGWLVNKHRCFDFSLPCVPDSPTSNIHLIVDSLVSMVIFRSTFEGD